MEKLSKIGELTLQKFTTQIYATEAVKKNFKSKKLSLSVLIPAAWLWYDNELLEVIDENGDGEPDERFGKEFKIVYFLKTENIDELEQDALFISRTQIKDINLKYACLKTEEKKEDSLAYLDKAINLKPSKFKAQ